MPDERFHCVRDHNTPCDVSYIKSNYTKLDLWLERAAELRERVLVSAGLLPMPEKTPLNAVISGRIERDDYSVEKVYFESLPGFYVAGNLYRTLGRGALRGAELREEARIREGEAPAEPALCAGTTARQEPRPPLHRLLQHPPFPGVLNPHGHWKEGRLQNDDTCSVPGRCINFAKQGYVAFTYDMVDYVDSRQWEHRRWDLRDRLWGISTGGLQLWNSIRAVDFLQSLPDVDPDRIACTGASGGGTQAFLLCAVDDRVKVSAPVNMISAHMQGGCLCENPPGLRIDTDNVEIGALMAPRPMLMVSATGDWTKDTPEIEFPAIRHIYRLFGAEDKVEFVQVDAGHNYNKLSREAVYSFFGRWLPEKPLPQPVKEQPFKVEQEVDLRVFPDGMPDGALDIDGLVQQRISASEAQFKAHAQTLYPDSPEALAEFAETYRPAVAHALGLPRAYDVGAVVVSEETDVDISTKRVLIEERNRGARLPAVVVEPIDSIPVKAVIVVDGPGGESFMGSGAVRHLVERGWRVISIDCFGTGPNAAPKDAPERDLDKDFFDTYNRTDTQERAYDIVVAAKWASKNAERVALVGRGMGGPWCLLAAPFAEEVTDVAVDACGLDVSNDEVLVRDLYVPGLRRAGGFQTAKILCPPRRLLIHSMRPAMNWIDWLISAYLAAGCDSNIRIHPSHFPPLFDAEWLCKE